MLPRRDRGGVSSHNVSAHRQFLIHVGQADAQLPITPNFHRQASG